MNQGTLERVGDRWRLRYVRTLEHQPDKVWRAITDPDHVSSWFPTDIEGEWRAGASLRFTFRNGEGPTMHGEVRVCEPPRVLEFTWGDDLLRYELASVGDGTELTFFATLDERGKAARDGAGWHVCLDVLAEHLDGAAGAPMDGRWEKVHDHYVADFGPEFSTIGPPDGARP